MTPTARFSGSNSERQSVGDPGHCERCAEVGHVAAHPDLGCGDVGCYSYHDEPSPASPAYTGPDFREAYIALERSVSDTLGTALFGWGDVDGVPHPAWGDHVAESLAQVAADEVRALRQTAAMLATGVSTYVWQWDWTAEGIWHDLRFDATFTTEEQARAVSDEVARRINTEFERVRLVRRTTIEEQLD